MSSSSSGGIGIGAGARHRASGFPPPETATPHLANYITRFNLLVSWVATEVLHTVELKDRAAVVKRFVLIAQKLFLLNNYSTLSAIISGLNMPCVARLTHTWERISDKYTRPLRALQNLVDPARNYEHYRRQARAAHPPFIPLVALLLRDLSVIHGASPLYVDQAPGSVPCAVGLVDFARLRIVAQIVFDIQRFQASQYFLPFDSEVYSSLKVLFVDSDAELKAASLELEPSEKLRSLIRTPAASASKEVDGAASA
eukprot:c54090_g1_i1.p1 GENE.c54090_g1_i1~~c54090_g1_i1.p1  ORF type:complete len:285 (+),score=55.21 c54090_g1_i1:89-856(+)